MDDAMRDWLFSTHAWCPASLECAACGASLREFVSSPAPCACRLPAGGMPEDDVLGCDPGSGRDPGGMTTSSGAGGSWCEASGRMRIGSARSVA